MNLFLSYEQPWLEQHNGIHTAKEISHQPRLWRALADILEQQYDAVSAFLNPRLAQPNLRIILTGAGTSAFVG
ncbi:tagatose-6-phosphate ketose isomerase, partial [Vibrio anguillarum]|nr:tagatose-6-phosphate ketose isomerase [Vibrio anguillarum]